jgi:PKD repeat protein
MRRLSVPLSSCFPPVLALLLVLASCTQEVSDPTGPDVSFQAAVTGSSGIGGLNAVVTETGKISLSLDGLGFITPSPNNSGTIQVSKPTGATVRKAYLATSIAFIPSGTVSPRLIGAPPSASVTLNGALVTYSQEVPNGIGSYNYWADVTGIVKPIVDAAAAGTVNLTLRESHPGTYGIEGEILAVVFDDPAVTTENTVLLFFGAMLETYDAVDASLAVTFDDPIDLSDPALRIDFSLGISFSNQGGVPPVVFDDATFVDVNGTRVTSCAGGYDDGGQAPGAFITVGGIGNSRANPGYPNCDATQWPAPYETVFGGVVYGDDELYDLIPFVDDSDTSLLVEMGNHTVFDDNLFFAAFDIAQTPPPPNNPPIADAGDPYAGAEGSPVAFDGSGSSDGDGSIVSYAWDFGDGSPAGSGATPSHTYADNGTYTVTLNVTDDDGASSTTTTTATIANVAPTLSALVGPLDPTRVGTAVSVSGTFTDPGVLDTHTATFDWGDGTSGGGRVSEAGGSGSVSGSHAYAEPGVYTVAVTLTDNDLDSDQRTYEFVVVYDPDAGFVTGGGWIDSPAGAYKPDLGLSGRANFGFVSKYKNGASVPTGNTEFQFRAGDLNFKSSSYEFLVVNQGGARAQYKGSGAINGSGAYKFMIWAGDGSPDTFRIRIWSESAGVETTVYDNGYDQALGGGSIVIHRK